MNCTAFTWLIRALFCLALTTSTLTSSAQLGIPYGDATNLGGGCYRLTNNSNGQRGSVWYFGTVDVSVSWEMTADVYLGNNNSGADGMVFVLRDFGGPTWVAEAVASWGTAVHWNTPEIEPSVAFKWTRIKLNNHADPYYDHLAIFRDGEVNHDSPQKLSKRTSARVDHLWQH